MFSSSLLIIHGSAWSACISVWVPARILRSNYQHAVKPRGKYHTDPSPPTEPKSGRKSGDAGRMNGESSFEGVALERVVDFLFMLKTREGDDELSLSTVFSTALEKRWTLDWDWDRPLSFWLRGVFVDSWPVSAMIWRWSSSDSFRQIRHVLRKCGWTRSNRV